MNLDCYKYAVGLSRSSCNCGGAPANYNRSDSGLYLDELGSLGRTLGGYDDCSAGGMWQALTRARERGILSFIADTNREMMAVGRVRRTNFSGTIGEGYAKDSVTTSKTYNGIRILCAPVKSGTLKIRRIGTLFSATGTVTVTIYDRNNETVGDPIVLDTTAGQHDVTTLATPLELPLLADFASVTEYFFVYEVADAPGTAKNNRLHCGCGGFNPRYDCARPAFDLYNHYAGEKAWANWVSVGGWEGDTLTDFDDPPTTADKYLNGLTLDAEIYCSPAAALCDGELNFNTYPHALESAEAIMLVSAVHLVTDKSLSTDLNRNLQANREALDKAAAGWGDLYQQRVKYIATHTDLTNSDCLECRPKMGLRTRTVYS